MQKTTNKETNLPIWYKLMIIILVLAFIILGFAFKEDWEYALSNHYYKESSMNYRVDDEDYYNLYNYTTMNEIHGYQNTGNLEKYADIGKYYYQALPYYALKSVGSKRAGDYLSRMEEYRTQMGEFTEHADNIDTLLKH